MENACHGTAEEVIEGQVVEGVTDEFHWERQESSSSRGAHRRELERRGGMVHGGGEQQ